MRFPPDLVGPGFTPLPTTPTFGAAIRPTLFFLVLPLLFPNTWDSAVKISNNSYPIRVPHIVLAQCSENAIDVNNKAKNIFVHGGFDRHLLLKEQSVPYIYYWDRDLFYNALSYGKIEEGDDIKYPKRGKFKIEEPCKEIFIGHTSTVSWNTDKPINAANVWNLDTGAGFYGKLTIMDIDTKEYWQSDLVRDLYPEEKGRN